jgi:hypothetical protein
MALSDGKVSFYNRHQELLGEAEIGDILTFPAEEMLLKLVADAQDEFAEALKEAFEPLPDDATEGQVLDAVNTAYSRANVIPKLLTLLQMEAVKQLHERMLPLAEDAINRSMAHDGFTEGAEQFIAAQKMALVNQITKKRREGK